MDLLNRFGGRVLVSLAVTTLALVLSTLGCGATEIDAVTLPNSTAGSNSAAGASSFPPPSNPLPSANGMLHTEGARIVDADGNEVRLVGINWFGLETGNYALHGLWTRSLASFLDQIAALGFNSIRAPFSNQLFDATSTPNSIDFNQNPELSGLSGLEILDRLVDEARARDLRLVLDRHHPDASSASDLWYSARYDEQRWIDDWVMLAERYAGDPTLIGFELHDGPSDPATWGDGSVNDWRAAAERAGNAILAANSELLIFVPGIETVGTTSAFGGENLGAAGADPVELTVPNRVVYTAHDFSASVSRQAWFDAADYPQNLPATWDALWGYLARDEIAPVYVSAFGTRLDTTEDQQWLAALVEHLNDRQLSFAFWCLNPNSGDTGGLLLDDWMTVDEQKLEALAPLIASP
jgi:endoglucanase